jgi:hypothetical protein
VADEKPKSTGENKMPMRPKWKKGQSGNPKGRPRGSVNITSAIKRALAEALPGTDKRRLVDQLAEAAIQNARWGNGTIFREIINRVDGVQAQRIDLSTVSDEDLLAEAAKIIARAKQDEQ